MAPDMNIACMALYIHVTKNSNNPLALPALRRAPHICGRFSVTHEMDGKPSLKIVNVFPVSNEHVQEDFLF